MSVPNNAHICNRTLIKVVCMHARSTSCRVRSRGSPQRGSRQKTAKRRTSTSPSAPPVRPRLLFLPPPLTLPPPPNERRVRHVVATPLPDPRLRRRRPQREVVAAPDVVPVHVRRRLPEHVHVPQPRLDHRLGGPPPHPRDRRWVRGPGGREDAARAHQEHGGQTQRRDFDRYMDVRHACSLASRSFSRANGERGQRPG